MGLLRSQLAEVERLAELQTVMVAAAASVMSDRRMQSCVTGRS